MPASDIDAFLKHQNVKNKEVELNNAPTWFLIQKEEKSINMAVVGVMFKTLEVFK